MNEKIKILKIPLELLIEVLVNMYNSGLEYVNMTVEKGDKQDSVWLDGEVDDIPEKKEVINNIDLEDLA